MHLSDSLSYIVKHPLNRKAPLLALLRWFFWQVKSRISQKPIVVDFFNGSKLLVSTGMTGATGNIYCGLHEFEFMSFLIHLLREKDVFIDVGANIGSYSILGGSLKARCVCFEPIKKTYSNLLENIKLNHYEEYICPFNFALADKNEFVTMTTNFDTTNKICKKGDVCSGDLAQVECKTLDSMSIENPVVIKIDTEGFEEQVIRGGKDFFRKESLLAAIVETNKPETHQIMLDADFLPYQYHPFLRELQKIESWNKTALNTIYLRNVEKVLGRIKTAPRFKILNQWL